MNRKLGPSDTASIRIAFDGRLPAFTDLVCYWFEQAREMVVSGEASRVGFVATNSIRKNTNLNVLHRITKDAKIFGTWNEEKWTVEGAAVGVSMICFGHKGVPDEKKNNGQVVPNINADLTTGTDLTSAAALQENDNCAFLGIQKSGPFDVAGKTARVWMAEPENPNGKQNSEVLKPYWNGDDLTARPRDMWIIDLPLGLKRTEASRYTTPFHHLKTTRDEDGKTLQELREAIGEQDSSRWWEPWRPRSDMRSRIEKLTRYLVTAETAQHRIFVWLSYPVLPDKNLIVIARDDDLTFCILQSKYHAAWALRKGSDLENRPRYTHTTTFATFPFPKGMTPDIVIGDARKLNTVIAIEEAAVRLYSGREKYLNPESFIKCVPEIHGNFDVRIVPKDAAAATALRKRTLTNLYNERPEWLASDHEALDKAVATAYGWPEDISTEDALAALLDLNRERAAAQGKR